MTPVQEPWQERAALRQKQRKESQARINGERKDEKFVTDAIIEYCRLQGQKFDDIQSEVEIEETKPDRLLITKDQPTILLEIRQSGTGFISEENKLYERCESENPIMSNSEKLQELIVQWVKPAQRIIVMIVRPLKKTGKAFLNKLNEELKSHFCIDTETNMKIIRINNEEIQARSTMFYQGRSAYSPLILCYGPGLSSINPALDNSLERQALYILSLCIKEKEKKYGKVSLIKWLGILNVHPLLRIDDYIRAYRLLLPENMKSCFQKIFVIIDGKAHLLS